MIQSERIQADIQAIARCTHTPGEGATRPTFSDAWGEARAYVINQAEAVGCEVRIDPAGNVHARPAGLGWDAKAWLVGSHIDSVPNGGDYDGVAGVLVGLELLRSAAEDSIASLPVELIVFAEEEGPTFGRGMLGSLTLAGELNSDALSELKNAQSQNYIEAGERFGVSAEALPMEHSWLERCLGLLELHAEQGPGMWRRDERLALVRSIAGRRQYSVTVSGEANHAGATTMADRRDALAAAAEMVLSLEALACELSPEAVVTVGRLTVQPNAINVIADRVAFTIDMRAPDDDQLEQGDAQLRSALQKIAERRGVALQLTQTEALPSVALDDRLVRALSREAELHRGGETPVAVSGALHDSAVVAPHLPTVMLFVPSKGGISHNPEEFSRYEDVALGAAVVQRLVRRPLLSSLNAMDQEIFTQAIGHCYEHSPWIAERAWEHRPFQNIDALAAAMCRALSEASKAEQLALINAHPDLVGRLAKTGQLTADSTAEQRAAGLDDVTQDEARRFEQYNEAYREKFGFPFVICARENRKDTILTEMPRRLKNDTPTETATALAQINKIARLRLNDTLWEDTPA